MVACLLVAGAATAGSRSEASPNAAVPDTLIYAGAADPTYLDPALVSDGESFRVTKQIYESLVDFAPGTTRLVPGLAKTWSVAKDGRTYTFNLRGREVPRRPPFNAAAVCANFNRWYNSAARSRTPRRPTTTRRSSAASSATRSTLGKPLYRSCRADGKLKAVDQADAEERPVRSVARPLGVLDPESGRDGEVGREPGHDPQRRLRSDRDVCVPASDRHGPVPAREVDGR